MAFPHYPFHYPFDRVIRNSAARLDPLRILAAPEAFHLAPGSQVLKHAPDEIDAHARTRFLQIGNPELPLLARNGRRNKLGLGAPGKI